MFPFIHHPLFSTSHACGFPPSSPDHRCGSKSTSGCVVGVYPAVIVPQLSTKTFQNFLALLGDYSGEERTVGVRVKAHRIIEPHIQSRVQQSQEHVEERNGVSASIALFSSNMTEGHAPRTSFLFFISCGGKEGRAKIHYKFKQWLQSSFLCEHSFEVRK
jgi:hypothetical protein